MRNFQNIFELSASFFYIITVNNNKKIPLTEESMGTNKIRDTIITAFEVTRATENKVPMLLLSNPGLAKTSIVNEVNKKEDGAANDSRQNQPSNEQIKQAVEKLNKSMPNSEAVFGIHEGTNRVTIKIVDRSTKEVIKELPPEKTLDMIARVWEMAGLLVDEKR